MQPAKNNVDMMASIITKITMVSFDSPFKVQVLFSTHKTLGTLQILEVGAGEP